MCHPHPVHGGTMHTKAVYRAAQGYNEAGLVALRFNFRGVGTSTGSHDEGVGEQEDLKAALDWLEAKYPSLPLLVGGFSFGSMVGLTVGAEDDRVVALLGLASLSLIVCTSSSRTVEKASMAFLFRMVPSWIS